MCDVGLCPEPTPRPTTLVTGETTEVIEWAAYSWNGPSDYGADYGDPFTAGEYTIEVTASGFFTAADGTEMTPFTIVATRPVVLVE